MKYFNMLGLSQQNIIMYLNSNKTHWNSSWIEISIEKLFIWIYRAAQLFYYVLTEKKNSYFLCPLRACQLTGLKKPHWIHFKTSFLPKMSTIWKTKIISIIFNHKIQECFSNCYSVGMFLTYLDITLQSNVAYSRKSL